MYIINENKHGRCRYYYTCAAANINYAVIGFSRRGARKRLVKRFPNVHAAGIKYAACNCK